MPKIIIDGRSIESRPGIPVLQAALEAGFNIPHYCYHPGLSIVASCRLCLMEMKMPHPKTNEMAWAPKLFPSCQTPVKDGMEVRFNSELVTQNQRHVMEDYLLNHPLDCPVCDKAGECYLQDYSEQFGTATSRMVDDKLKNPKKDIGTHTLLYQDRCVLCSRCVRFCQEVAGTGELAVVNRGGRCEIDVFPGQPLENPLQGNVVDLCPVGALLDKQFLFKQRVWLLRTTKSVNPVDSQGQTIWIDWNEQGPGQGSGMGAHGIGQGMPGLGPHVHRIRPRYNEKVNAWWISDEARFDWQYIQREDRLRVPAVRSAGELRPTTWEELPALVRAPLAAAAARAPQQSGDGNAASRASGGGAVAAVLSPFMACEEAWLLAKFVRGIAPDAALAVGYVPVIGEDYRFPKGFVIKAEKCPNRRGVETMIDKLGGPMLDWRSFLGQAVGGRFRAAYVVGGQPHGWVNDDVVRALSKIETLIVHDLFPTALDAVATIRIPAVSWAEREGTFMNCDGLLQPFERALPPLEGAKADGQFLYELAGYSGLFLARKVRAEMAAEMPEFAEVFEPRPSPKYAH